ncbi:MAG: sigma-70 family RNA polymerase sigma factor [Planctomycetes bacterium]|nr:sigma-70 family RNA polymerase sigma factor [Planctomycetota bacterium]
MVDLRLHPRLRGRIDPSDVLQDAFLDASRKLPRYLRDAPMPVFLWLRRVTADRLHDIHRDHLAAKARDARREVPLRAGPAGPEASSFALADVLLQKGASPSEAAIHAEERASIQNALDSLDATDREILVLRYFEKLSSAEAAQVLGLREEATRKRYLKALKRLREVFEKKHPHGNGAP